MLIPTCWESALFNQKHAYRDLKLKVVYGSLGFVIKERTEESKAKIFWEFGGPKRKRVEEFRIEMFRCWDIHVWLEDDKGRVYDIVGETWKNIATLRGCPSAAGLKAGLVLKGMKKSDLRLSYGLAYYSIRDKDLHDGLRGAIEGHPSALGDQLERDGRMVNAQVERGKVVIETEEGHSVTVILPECLKDDCKETSSM